MIRNSVVLAEVEEFIRRWNSGELVLGKQDSDSMTVTYSTGEKNFWGRLRMFKKPLPDYLGWAIAQYQVAKELGNPRELYEIAYTLLDTIQRARAYGAIVDIKQQATDYESEIKRLKEQINNLLKTNEKLAQENKVLHILADGKTKTKGDTEVGDVEK